ncbi:MAG TPA: hypothetical protein VFI99_00845, partial [Nocardioides sp.]|nr:hypothetical protein [Nocardioides sp.]
MSDTMSTTTSYPQVLRVIALLTAVVLFSWGTAALSPADAVEHGNTHKTTKSNNGNGATATDKTNNGHSQTTSPSSSSTDTTSSSSTASTSPGKGAGQAQQGGSSTAAASGSGGGAEQGQAATEPTDTGKTTGKPAGTSSEKGDPAGNNGTVKLAGFDAPNGPGHSSGDGSTAMHPSNDPHLPCDFSVEGYGFD